MGYGCLKYKGIKYDIGTKVKLKTKWNGIVTTTFLGNTKYDCPYAFNSLMPPEDYIVEIVEPVYYKPQNVSSSNNNKVRPFKGDVQIGWIWYIIIMVVGSIFNDRLLIWIGATAYFFLWKNGYLNGDKK